MKSVWAILCDSLNSSEVGDHVVTRLGKFRYPRKPRVGKGDQVVLFVREGREISFWGAGRAADLEEETAPDELKQSEESFRYINISIELDEVFDEVRTLDDLRFSLEKVRRFQTPGIHFRRYSTISESDAMVIADNAVHWSRTAVGLLVEVLPLHARIEILHRWLAQVNAGTHRELGHFVLDVVHEAYVVAAQIVCSASDLASELRLDDTPILGVEISDNKGGDFRLSGLRENAEPVAKGFGRETQGVFESMLEMDDDSDRNRRRTSTVSLDEAFRILMVHA